jgi:hypothetical protein
MKDAIKIFLLEESNTTDIFKPFITNDEIEFFAIKFMEFLTQIKKYEVEYQCGYMDFKEKWWAISEEDIKDRLEEGDCWLRNIRLIEFPNWWTNDENKIKNL